MGLVEVSLIEDLWKNPLKREFNWTNYQQMHQLLVGIFCLYLSRDILLAIIGILTYTLFQDAIYAIRLSILLKKSWIETMDYFAAWTEMTTIHKLKIPSWYIKQGIYIIVALSIWGSLSLLMPKILI
jgi:hypothetical protein